jgi:hypothetical protein
VPGSISDPDEEPLTAADERVLDGVRVIAQERLVRKFSGSQVQLAVCTQCEVGWRQIRHHGSDLLELLVVDSAVLRLLSNLVEECLAGCE